MHNIAELRPTLAVGGVIINERKVLLVLRSKSPSKGTWAIPGGRVELGESLPAAVEREIIEETGLEVLVGELLFFFDVIERDQHGAIYSHSVVLDFKATVVGGELRSGDDALDARWFSKGELDRYPVQEKTRELLDKIFLSEE